MSLAIDQGMEFCQLNVDIVGHVCAIGEKQYLHCTFRQFRCIEVSATLADVSSLQNVQ